MDSEDEEYVYSDEEDDEETFGDLKDDGAAASGEPDENKQEGEEGSPERRVRFRRECAHFRAASGAG